MKHSSNRPHTLALVGITLSVMLAEVSSGATLFFNSPVVTTVDRTLTFDALSVSGIDLKNYVENGVFVTVDDSSFIAPTFAPFQPGDDRRSGFHYGENGNDQYVSIRPGDFTRFSALEFLLGDGINTTTTNLQWRTYRDGVLVGSGIEMGVTKGGVFGWTDPNGFDELQVAASLLSSEPGFGNMQAIAIDDLKVTIVSIPEPVSGLVFFLAGSGLLFRRRG